MGTDRVALGMDFVFMLTRADRTIRDGLEVLEDIRSLGLRHIGFKDVGIDPAALAELHRAIKQTGATSYLEVVSTTPESCLQSARVAAFVRVAYAAQGVALCRRDGPILRSPAFLTYRD